MDDFLWLVAAVAFSFLIILIADQWLMDGFVSDYLRFQTGGARNRAPAP